jgi:hypothetical protein
MFPYVEKKKKRVDEHGGTIESSMLECGYQWKGFCIDDEPSKQGFPCSTI